MRPQNPDAQYAIEFDDISRRFVLHHERRVSFQDWFVGLIKPRGETEEFWALRNVTFGVRWGESIGIVGRNGAGKSTLLKLVTRILEPSSGKVFVNGRAYGMLELGAGFHPELSGRDNIFLNGSLYGFSRKEMSQKYDEIVQFAELERVVDTPVKHYSSGMFARLGFGIAVNMNPEILVIDEVLAVGDERFQEKCFHALDALKAGGTTILFVSHDSDTVRAFCDRAALIDGGHLIDIGPANDVVDHYQQLLHTGEPNFSLLRVRALDDDGQPVETILAGGEVTFEAIIRVPAGSATDGLELQLDLDRLGGTNLWSTRASLPSELPVAHQGSRSDTDAPDARVARLHIGELPVRSGSLRLVATLSHIGAEQHLIDRQETMLQVDPTDPRQRGLLRINHDWEWEMTAPEDAKTSSHSPVDQEQMSRR